MQMGLFLHRYRGNGEGDPLKRQLLDPRDIPFDQLMIAYTAECDQKLQDESMQSEGPDSLISVIQKQLLESQQGPEQQIDSSSSTEPSIDKLLKNIMITICLNTNVKTDIVQLLRLILKYKADNGYPCRNQIINALTFVMKISAKKDTGSLLAFFEIDVPAD